MKRTRIDEDRACQHRGYTGERAEQAVLADGTPYMIVQRACYLCHAQLPLGPANDRGVPAVEMRLAESLAFQDLAPDPCEFIEAIVWYWVDRDDRERDARDERARRSRRLRRG